ncbi:MAG TPA: rhodanese-like domain-containing protein [Vicinamibacterales bacterium]
MTVATHPTEHVPEISRDDLVRALRAGGITLVDVLPPESFAAVHIPGAINLPLVDLLDRARQTLPDQNAAIVTYCGGPTCPKGAQAVRELNQMGYTNVSHYRGGLEEWLEYEPQKVTVTTRAVTTGGIAERAAPPARIPFAGRLAARELSIRFVDALADRSISQLFVLWIEIVLGGGVAYWLLGWLTDTALMTNGAAVDHGARGLLTAIYFSAVTATSVGYGDIVPAGVARILAILEAIGGLILFGCVVSKFVSRRQEQLIGEIHHIAFEDRLGRVRTNLLLVRTELQATARLCAGQSVAPPEAVARAESAAMVFVGELRAVHDLLYRPQETPEEPVLEAILAGLASVFREFNELLLCVEARSAPRPPALATSVAAMSRLAREICGDCVPRQFAPALRSWMDQIQRLARQIEQI